MFSEVESPHRPWLNGQMLSHLLLPAAFALGVGLLPQSFIPWTVLAFRRDWGMRKRWAAAALAATLLTAGGWLLSRGWQALIGPVTPLAAASWILALTFWRVWMSPRREELWRQGRRTRAPLWLAAALTGPSEIGAWVFARAGEPAQIALWFAVLWITLGVQITAGQERLNAQPALLAHWLPESRLRAGLTLGAWTSVLAAVGVWGGLSFWIRASG